VVVFDELPRPVRPGLIETFDERAGEMNTADQPIDDTAGANPVSPATGKKTNETLKETLEKELEKESETRGLSDEELRKISAGTAVNPSNSAIRQ
jgi:hypothetical protein